VGDCLEVSIISDFCRTNVIIFFHIEVQAFGHVLWLRETLLPPYRKAPESSASRLEFSKKVNTIVKCPTNALNTYDAVSIKLTTT
jgi:hypothetical protein